MINQRVGIQFFKNHKNGTTYPPNADMIARSSSLISRTASFRALGIAFYILTATGLGAYVSQNSPPYLLLLIAFLGVLILLSRGRLLVFQLKSSAWWLGVFMYMFFAVVAFVGSTGGRAPMLINLIIFVLAFSFVALLGRNPEGVRSVVLPALLVSIFVNLYEYFFAQDTFSISPGRAAGFLINPNVSGTMLGGLWALWLMTIPGRLKVSTLIISVLAFLATLVTFSRGAIVAFVLISMVMVPLLSRRHHRDPMVDTIWGGVVVSLAYLIFVVFARSDLSEEASFRIDSLIGMQFLDDSSQGRFDAARFYWGLFLDSPMTGRGDFSSLADLGVGPHNMFIAIAADFGLLALVYFLYILVLGVFSPIRNRFNGEADRVRVILVAWFVVSSMFSHNILYDPGGSLLIGVLLGFVAVDHAGGSWREKH